MDKRLLTHLGYSKTASDIYLAALALGTASIQDLSKQAKIKRSTAYPYINELLEEGLLIKIPLGKRELYRAAKPKKLQEKAEKNLHAITSALPELTYLSEHTKGRPVISVLEGKTGIAEIYKELQTANTIRFWSKLEDIEKYYDDFFDEIAETIKKNEITTREIIVDTPEAKRSSKKYIQQAGRTYQSRIASKEGISNDSIIYGDIVALLRIHEYNFFAIRIEDKTIADSMKALFDMAWESAKPFN